MKALAGRDDIGGSVHREQLSGRGSHVSEVTFCWQDVVTGGPKYPTSHLSAIQYGGPFADRES